MATRYCSICGAPDAIRSTDPLTGEPANLCLDSSACLARAKAHYRAIEHYEQQLIEDLKKALKRRKRRSN